MKKIIAGFFCLFYIPASICQAGIFDDFMGELKKSPVLSGGSVPDLETTISGLKEALSLGTENAVSFLSKNNGYLGNAAVKILMPEKIQNVAATMKKFGFQKQVESFELSMNRAAEKAAPQAKGFFLDAIKEMSFEDAQGILKGDNTSATEYLKSKTSGKIYDAFKPLVGSSLNEVGGTAAYNNMMKTFTSLPFMSAQTLDLNHYVTEKAMGGLFLMVGEEEKKIRTNPTARVTDLLKNVFGKKG